MNKKGRHTHFLKHYRVLSLVGTGGPALCRWAFPDQ